MKNRHFANFHIAGFTYNDGIDVFENLKIGTPVTLVAEPENGFDPNAVAIYFNEFKLGFVPKSENKEVSQFLNLGYTNLFEAKINRVSPEEHPEQQVSVIVRIKEKK